MTDRLYSCKQIATALDVNVRIVQLRAKNGVFRKDEPAWAHAELRTVQGNEERLFAYASLPPDVRRAIDAHEAKTAGERNWALLQADMEAERARRQDEELSSAIERNDQAKAQELRQQQRTRREGRARFAKLPKDSMKRLRAEARQWALFAAAAWRQKQGFAQRQGWFDFAARVNGGEIEIPERFRAALPRSKAGTYLSEGALRDWHGAFNALGPWGLVDGYKNRSGTSKIENTPPLESIILGAFKKKPHITGRKIKEWIRAERPDLDIVSAAGIDRYLRRLRAQQPQLWTYLTHPDKWKNIHMAAPGSAHERIVRLNQVWEMDSTPGDWLLKDGRHSVIGCIDLYSRRVKLYVSKTSTTTAVKQLTRRCLLEWGVPEAIRTDNGPDYVSEAYNSLLSDLEILHEICLPFASEQKGTIERFFRTMSHGVLDLLDGFIGHNVAERKVIEARKSFAARIMDPDATVEVSLTAAELQAKLDAWVEHIYQENPHRGLDYRTPRAVGRDWNEPVAMLESEHILDDLLSEFAGTRQITKKGVRVEGRWYVDRDCAMWAHVGEAVVVRYDEHDLGQVGLYLPRNGELEFLSWAYNEDTLGIDRAEYAAAAKHAQRKFLASEKAKLKTKTAEFMRELKRDPVDAIIEMRKAEAGNVVDLPKRTVPYSTPAIEQSKRAHQARQPSAPADLTDEQREIQAQLVAQADAEVVPISQGNDPTNDFRRCLRVGAHLAAGEAISDADRNFYRHYHNSDSYRAMRDLFDQFPELYQQPGEATS